MQTDRPCKPLSDFWNSILPFWHWNLWGYVGHNPPKLLPGIGRGRHHIEYVGRQWRHGETGLCALTHKPTVCTLSGWICFRLVRLWRVYNGCCIQWQWVDLWKWGSIGCLQTVFIGTSNYNKRNRCGTSSHRTSGKYNFCSMQGGTPCLPQYYVSSYTCRDARAQRTKVDKTHRTSPVCSFRKRAWRTMWRNLCHPSRRTGPTPDAYTL